MPTDPKRLIKAYMIPPAFKTQRVPGQVPDLEAIRLQKEVEKPPKEFSVARLLAHDDPILKVEAIAQNLGFDIQTENDWSAFLGDVLTGGNEVSIRKAVLSKCIEEKLDPALRRAILARSLNYWRGKMRKSLIEVVSPDELAKSGRYITRSELALYTKENIKKVEDSLGYAGKVTLNELKAAGGQMKLYIDLEKSKEVKKRDGGLLTIAEVKKRAADYLEKSNPSYKKITIYARDQENSLEKLLNKIKYTGNIGHSFSIVVDPDSSDYKESFGWDGDGSDHIGKIQVEKVEEFKKSGAIGGTYYRKVPKKKGKGDNYYYTREDYNKSKQAHTSGQDNERTYLSGKVQDTISKAGEKGCDVAGFEELVKKYGAKKIANSLREGKDSYEFKKGRFYGKVTGGDK